MATVGRSTSSSPRMIDTGLLLLRLAIGLPMAAHGTQKLFGWFGGHGLTATGGAFESMGFAPGALFATLAGGAEVTGGLLIALGLLGVLGPAMVIGVMLVATVAVHLPNGFFAATNGFEVPLLYGAGALALALVGFGRHALDSRVALPDLRRPAIVAGALGATVIGAFVSLLAR